MNQKSIIVLLCLVNILLMTGIIQSRTMIKEQRSFHGYIEKMFEGILTGCNLAEQSKFQYVTLTAYTGKKLTATMQKPVSGWTVAISDDLIKKGWLGRKVYIDGHGVFQATDRLGGYNSKWIDIYAPNKKHAIKFGIKKQIMACVLE